MTDDWATSVPAPRSVAGTDLHLELTGPGLRAGLMDALREAVRTGRLVPGTRLPSSRSLAADLGVARNTVADAYAELIAEGWLTAQQGSGHPGGQAGRAAPGSRPPLPVRGRPRAVPRTACCRAHRTSRSFPARSGSPRPDAP